MATTAARILLVDDEEKFLHSLSQRLTLMGYDPRTAESGRQAVEIARTDTFDMAIVDLKMPDMDGLVTIAKLKEIHPGLKTVLLTGFGSEKVKQATEALDAAYFEKDEMADFWSFIKNSHLDGNVIVIQPPGANRSHGPGAGMAEKTFPSGKIQIHRDFPSPGTPAVHTGAAASHGGILPAAPVRMIGETLSMQNLRRSIKQFAALDCSVIIYGETGVGKELAARIIHDSSPRRHQRFTAINCGCFSNDLLIEEVFSSRDVTHAEHITGKHRHNGIRPGGTLLLDHIEEMSENLQLSLLKILDRSKTARRSSDDVLPLDIRIFAASRDDLGERVRKGTFREELYYRLNVVELTIPPLRERREDIAPLSRYFLSRYAEEFGKRVDTISEAVLSRFMSYDFPGNVRELEHVIERAVILAEGNRLEPDHLPERFRQSETPMRPRSTAGGLKTLAQMEKAYILHVLDAVGGNKSKTADTLGISRAALWRKLKQFSQEPDEE